MQVLDEKLVYGLPRTEKMEEIKKAKNILPILVVLHRYSVGIIAIWAKGP